MQDSTETGADLQQPSAFLQERNERAQPQCRGPPVSWEQNVRLACATPHAPPKLAQAMAPAHHAACLQPHDHQLKKPHHLVSHHADLKVLHLETGLRQHHNLAERRVVWCNENCLLRDLALLLASWLATMSTSLASFA